MKEILKTSWHAKLRSAIFFVISQFPKILFLLFILSASQECYSRGLKKLYTYDFLEFFLIQYLFWQLHTLKNIIIQFGIFDRNYASAYISVICFYLNTLI